MRQAPGENHGPKEGQAPEACHVPKDWEFDHVFDAVDLGCGEFLIDFNMHIRPLPPGTMIMLATRDIASPMEVPAWCRLTGHELIEQSHPYYLIRKKWDGKKV